MLIFSYTTPDLSFHVDIIVPRHSVREGTTVITLFEFFFKWIDPVLMFHLFLQSICTFPIMFFKTFFQSSFIRTGNLASLGEWFIYPLKKFKEKYEIHYTADTFHISINNVCLLFASLLTGLTVQDL